MFIFGSVVTLLLVAVCVEIGFRMFQQKQEREKRRYIWEQDIIRIAKEGSGLRRAKR